VRAGRCIGDGLEDDVVCIELCTCCVSGCCVFYIAAYSVFTKYVVLGKNSPNVNS
jgi:hypothetical protein